MITNDQRGGERCMQELLNSVTASAQSRWQLWKLNDPLRAQMSAQWAYRPHSFATLVNSLPFPPSFLPSRVSLALLPFFFPSSEFAHPVYCHSPSRSLGRPIMDPHENWMWEPSGTTPKWDNKIFYNDATKMAPFERSLPSVRNPEMRKGGAEGGWCHSEFVTISRPCLFHSDVIT